MVALYTVTDYAFEKIYYFGIKLLSALFSYYSDLL